MRGWRITEDKARDRTRSTGNHKSLLAGLLAVLKRGEPSRTRSSVRRAQSSAMAADPTKFSPVAPRAEVNITLKSRFPIVFLISTEIERFLLARRFTPRNNFVSIRRQRVKGVIMSLALHYWIGDVHHCSRAPVSEMTYTVSSDTLNSTIPYHSSTTFWVILLADKLSKPKTKPSWQQLINKKIQSFQRDCLCHRNSGQMLTNIA